MSATTESLLLEISKLENELLEKRKRKEDCSELEEILLLLKHTFITLNETLNKNSSVLKG